MKHAIRAHFRLDNMVLLMMIGALLGLPLLSLSVDGEQLAELGIVALGYGFLLVRLWARAPIEEDRWPAEEVEDGESALPETALNGHQRQPSPAISGPRPLSGDVQP
jgi:hypothetical protein